MDKIEVVTTSSRSMMLYLAVFLKSLNKFNFDPKSLRISVLTGDIDPSTRGLLQQHASEVHRINWITIDVGARNLRRIPQGFHLNIIISSDY